MNQDAEGNSLNELAALRQRLEELEAEHRNLQRQVSRRPFFSRKFVLSALAGTLVMATVAILWGQAAISIFVDPNGNVGIGTNQPGAKLDVKGGAAFSSVGINTAPFPQQNLLVVAKSGEIPFNVTNPANTINWLAVDKAGEVRMNGASVNIGTGVTADTGTPLNVKGAADFTGTLNVSKDSSFKGYVGINTAAFNNQNLLIVPTQGNIPLNVTNPANTVSWLSVGPDGKVIMNGGAGLGVTGDVIINGKVSSKGRYQRDDEPEATYEIPPPYRLSLTYKNYAGKSKVIPPDVLDALCSTPCQVRMAMTKWNYDTETESASSVFWFSYLKTDGHWRINSEAGEANSVAGNGDTSKHVRNLHNVCFFTPIYYPGGTNRDKNMYLHVSTAGPYHNPNLTCELTISK